MKSKRKGRANLLYVAILAAAALLLWGASRLGLLSWGESAATPLPTGQLRVAYLDVGQGDCILLSCNDAYMLIDAGPVSAGITVTEYLKASGCEKLTYFVVTHAHEDHCGGADDVLTAFPVETLFAPYTEFDQSGAFTYFEDTAAEVGVDITMPAVGSVFTLSDATVTFVGPVSQGGDLNDGSLVLRVDYGDTSFLFTGDASSGALLDDIAAGYDLSCDVLKLSHHGSSDGTSDKLLQYVEPKMAVACVGADNRYGHPHEEVLSLLEAYDVRLSRTDTDGTVVLVSDGARIYKY
jgi:competence protein ComEC